MSLRLINLDDTAELFDLLIANQDHLEKSLHLDVEGLTTEKTHKSIADMIEGLEDGDSLQYRIMVNGSIAGSVTLHHIDPQEHEAHIGYWLGSEYEGNGYVLDAAKRLIRYGFDEMSLEKVLFEIHPNNFRSENVARSLGAHLTDRKPVYRVKDGSTVFFREWELTTND